MINNGLKHWIIWFSKGNIFKPFKDLLLPKSGRDTQEAVGYHWKSEGGCLHPHCNFTCKPQYINGWSKLLKKQSSPDYAPLRTASPPTDCCFHGDNFIHWSGKSDCICILGKMVIYVDNINPSALNPPKVSVVVLTYSFQISMLFLTFFNETPLQRHYVQIKLAIPENVSTSKR